MGQSIGLLILISLGLVVANAFFVAAEYALIGSRRSRIQAMERRRKRNASGLLKMLDDVSPHVAATQIGITMVGIAVGAVTEPFVLDLLRHLFSRAVHPAVAYVVSYLLVTFILVVCGELFPKYLTIRMPERVAILTFGLLSWITRLLMPLVWLAQAVASLMLKPFGISTQEGRSEAIPKDELLLLIRAGSSEGVIEKMQADLLARTLRLDELDANDIMIHRLDMKCLDADLPKEKIFAKLREIPHSRIPVFRGDLDNILGVVYVHDIVKSWLDPDFGLEKIVRPAVSVPENLTADKILTTMRDSKIQIVIVSDEYGGTSGLVTLEDVVEEVFGELQDQLEMERPAIERLPDGRITCQADVRYDELAAYLGWEVTEGISTDTLATLIVEKLGRVPKLGDRAQTELGVMYVENMARRRITRVSVLPKPHPISEQT